MQLLENASVLVVDDMKLARLRLKEVCETVGFKNILEATNGKEAWKQLADAKTPPVLILTDFNMPDMDGLGFLELVRKNEVTKITKNRSNPFMNRVKTVLEPFKNRIRTANKPPKNHIRAFWEPTKNRMAEPFESFSHHLRPFCRQKFLHTFEFYSIQVSFRSFDTSKRYLVSVSLIPENFRTNPLLIGQFQGFQNRWEIVIFNTSSDGTRHKIGV